MTEPTSSPVSDAGFELEGDGFKLTSFLFGLDLYTSKSFYAVPKGLLDAYDLFLKMCPP